MLRLLRMAAQLLALSAAPLLAQSAAAHAQASPHDPVKLGHGATPRQEIAAAGTPDPSPMAWGAVGDGRSHSVGATLAGVTSLAALAAYRPLRVGPSPYAWVTNPDYGLTFTISDNLAQGAADTVVDFPLTQTSAVASSDNLRAGPAFNYQHSARFVVPDMTVSGSCLPRGAVVRSVDIAYGTYINTFLAQYAVGPGRLVAMPHIGELAPGMPVSGTDVPQGATIADIVDDQATFSGYIDDGHGDAGKILHVAGAPAAAVTVGMSLSQPNSNNTQGVLNGTAIVSRLTTATGDLATWRIRTYPNDAAQRVGAAAAPVPFVGQLIGFHLDPGHATTTAIPPLTALTFDGVSRVILKGATSRPCPANTTLTFGLADAQVAALDMDWLGIQTAIVNASQATGAAGGAVLIPGGLYALSRSLVLPHTSGTTPQVTIRGAGNPATTLYMTRDTGAGTCAITKSDRAVADDGLREDYRDFLLKAPGSTQVGMGVSPVGMDGLCLSAQSFVSNVESDGFHSGFLVMGDHNTFFHVAAGNGYFGIELGTLSETDAGNQTISGNSGFSGTLASLAASADTGWNGAHFETLHLGFSPYAIFIEGGAPWWLGSGPSGMTQNGFVNVYAEGMAQGLYLDENATYGGTYPAGSYSSFSNNSFVGFFPGNYYPAYAIPSANHPALITTGAFQSNTFINADLVANFWPYIGNGTSGSLISAATIKWNKWLDDASSRNLANLGPTHPAPAQAIFDTAWNEANIWNAGASSGVFLTAEDDISAGDVVALGATYPYGRGGREMVAGGYAKGVANSIAAVGQTFPVTTTGQALVKKSTSGGIHIGQPVQVDPANPTAVMGASGHGATTRIIGGDCGTGSTPASAPSALVCLTLTAP